MSGIRLAHGAFEDYVYQVLKEFEAAEFNFLEISGGGPKVPDVIELGQIELRAELNLIGTGSAAHLHRVEMYGTRDAFRRLALLFLVQSLQCTEHYVSIRLDDGENNAIVLQPVASSLYFFGLRPLLLRYDFDDRHYQFTRFDQDTIFPDRPHVGYITDRNSRIGHVIPDWVNPCPFLSGSANARLLLAATILDHCHPSSDDVLELEKDLGHVRPISYDLFMHLED
jgi:hypothetical protein